MITAVRTGDILSSDAQTLVNTVNTVGVMGKGIALAFKRRFPDMYKDYERRCQAGEVRLGEPYLYRTLLTPWVINFPTKEHWRARSRLDDIERGLVFLAEHLEEWGVESLAVPPLGCGHGQLEWQVVGPTICRHLDGLPVPIELYAPVGAPREELTLEFVRGDSIPRRSELGGREGHHLRGVWVAVAEIVGRLDRDPFAWPVGQARFGQLAYFATTAGIPLGLTFGEGPHGPYAADTTTVLTRLKHNGILTEESDGQRRRIRPGTTFDDARNRFAATLSEHEGPIERVVDLFTRLQGSARAEIAARVHFAVSSSVDSAAAPAETDLVEAVLRQPYQGRRPLAGDVAVMVRDLGTLAWIDVEVSADLPIDDEILTVA